MSISSLESTSNTPIKSENSDLLNIKAKTRKKITASSNQAGTPIAESLEKEILKKIRQGIWPTSDPVLNSKVKAQVFRQRKELALTSVKGKNLNKNNSDYGNHWTKVTYKSSKYISSLVWKVVSIDVTAKGEGSITPGIDNKAFKPILMKCTSKSQALKQLRSKIKFLNQELSLYKGKTDQAKNRKRKLTSSSEKKRYWLKSKRPEAIEYVKSIKMEYKAISENPLNVTRRDRHSKILENDKLRFEILNAMKPQKLFNYKASPVKSVFIPKANGK